MNEAVVAGEMAPDRRTQGLIAINIAAIIFGTAALFGKIDTSPVWIVAMRAAFASLSLLGLILLRRRFVWPTVATSRRLLLTGGILAVHWVTFFEAVQLSGVAIATLTFATFPLFTVLLTGALRRRWPKPLEVVAGMAIVVAVGLLVNVDVSGRDEAIGALCGLGSAVAFALFGIYSTALGRILSPLSVSFFQNTVVAIVLAPVLLVVGGPPSTGEAWLWLVALGVVTTALMHQLYFFALQRLSPTICSGFVALEPVYAIILAAIIFGDAFSIWVVVSAAMIVGASILLLVQDREATAAA